MTQPTKIYLNHIKQNLNTGAATEHTHRPALAEFIESLAASIKVINEPRRIACGAPDLAVLQNGLMIGHVEAKDVGAPLDTAARSAQLKRYRAALDNLILTDYLEFRWYVAGKHRETVCLARWDGANLKCESGGAAALVELFTNFLAHKPQPIATPRELAGRLARLAHLIREIIITAFETDQASNLLRGWRHAFSEVLVADLDQPEKAGEFADMFAQTLAYGLFSARVMYSPPHPPAPSPCNGEGETRALAPSPHNGEDEARAIAPSLRSGEGVGGEVSSPRSGEGVGGEVSSPRSGEEARGRGFNAFTRQAAQKLIPKTNPFLRKFFYQITGPDLDDEPYAGFVNDLVQLLAQTDMGEILANFGKRTRQEDPTVHFYETFLAAYDPALREMRGVYYTPAPVVSFIVRSVDALLKMKFGLAQGLADTSKVTVENTAVHKVLILDPATGTATFPYAVIDFIREQFMQGGNAGMWSGYVREHLLPRIFGFELLMAPYAVAHFKLALQLAGHDLPEAQRATWAYDFARDERLGIYLTNALEEPEHEIPTLWGPLQIVTQEAEAANQVKQDQPIMVVIGNPPYAVSSSNQGTHIEGLMARYKEAVRGERNIQPLSDDYIKFIRFAHDRVERTGYGVIGFITNHSYLSGLIHRGMREELLKTFNEIYILNLHGNTLMSELAPDGSANENVFDIRQGVAIVFFVKGYDDENTGRVYYADLWGTRQEKYTYLLKNDLTTTAWQELETPAPHFFFVPKDFDLSSEYERGWSVADMFPLCVSGIKTHRDDLVIGFDERELYTQISMVRGERFSDDELRHRLRLRDNGLWALSAARETLRRDKDWEKSFTRCLYRPFDIRPIFYHEALIDRARNDVMQHMLQPNLALVTTRLFVGEHFTSVLASRYITEMKTGEATRGTYCFPLYLYITAENSMGTIFANGKPTREPNLSPQFLAAVKAKLKICFVPDGANTPQDGFGPQDIFAYIYALLHSPTYRARYAEFLKIDFPRVPLTSDNALFWQLVALGQQLIELHLLESPHVEQPITNYPIPGSNEVARRGGYPKYTPPDPAQDIGGRVHINKRQYFAGIPKEVWEFQIGGYQVLHKWLKDRRGRKLTYDDLTHYQKIVGALRETLRLMAEIDGAITRWPVE